MALRSFPYFQSISIVKTECIAYHHTRAKEYASAQKKYEAIVKPGDLSDAEGNRSKGKKKMQRAAATAPVKHHDANTPERAVSTSGMEESPASSSHPINKPERPARQRKKSYKLIDQLEHENADWFSDDSDLTEPEESDSDC